MPELKQAIGGGAERHGDSRGQLDFESFRDRPRISSRHRAQRRMRSCAEASGALLSHLQVCYLSTNLHDLTAGLVANDVRLAEQCAMPAIERVAAFDTYCLDANHDAFRMAFGIGNVLVLENFGTAVLIIDRSLHRASPYSTIAEYMMFLSCPRKLKVADGINWVIKIKTKSSFGSPQKIAD